MIIEFLPYILTHLQNRYQEISEEISDYLTKVNHTSNPPAMSAQFKEMQLSLMDVQYRMNWIRENYNGESGN